MIQLSHFSFWAPATDVQLLYDLNLEIKRSEMRAAAMLAAVTADDPAAITPADAFRAATEGGAWACRVDGRRYARHRPAG